MTGLFLAPDSIVPNPLDPQSLNRYLYARGNPLRYRDPSGHDWEDVVYNVQEFAGGLVAEWSYVNSMQMVQTLAAQPNESVPATAGRVVADVVGIYQGAEEMTGAGGVAAGGLAMCATGALCPAGAPAVAGGVTIATHGAAVASHAAVNAGTNLSNLYMMASANSQGAEQPPVAYRGGNSLHPNRGEVKFDKRTGMVLPQRGVSTNTDPTKVERFGGAYRIESLPESLQFRQVGADSGHYEIIPSEAMSWERYVELLDQIKTTPVSQP